MSYDQYVKWLEDQEIINKDKDQKQGVAVNQAVTPFLIGEQSGQCYVRQESWNMNDEELLEYNAEIFRKFAEIVENIRMDKPYDWAEEDDNE